MESKKGHHFSSSQHFLKPLSTISTHLDTRRKLLGTIQYDLSAFSPKKNTRENISNVSAGILAKSNSAYDVKSYLHSNFRNSGIKSKEKLSPIKQKLTIQMIHDSTPSLSKISLPKQLPRAILNIEHKSTTGMVGGKEKKHNQDAYLVIQNFAGVTNQILLGVMDGHGLYGDQVSNYVKNMLPKHMEKVLNSECKI